ncbi:MAG: PAS domain S-box protein [Elusimicrobia bacterium]|nr:PAS domain S-box protein [Elusimicrobiota bacterium]
MRISLTARFLIWILPVTFAAVLTTAAATYHVARRQIIGDVRKELDALGKNAAEQIRACLDQRSNDLATVSASPLFKDHYMNLEYGLLQEAGAYLHEIERMLLQFARRTGVYPQLSYVDASGREICRIRDAKIGLAAKEALDPADLAALRRLRPGQRCVSGIRRVPWHGSPVVRYEAPLRDEAGAFRGALVFDYSLKHVYGLLRRLGRISLGRGYLADRRSPRAWEGLSGPDPGLLATSSPVPGTSWSVILTADRDERLGGLRLVKNVAFVLALFASVLTLLAIVIQVRSTLQPVQNLVAAVNAYAEGDLDRRVRISKPGEIASLADAFNSMADRLKERSEELQSRIRELTALQRMSDAVLRQLGRREIGRTCLEAAVTGLGFERGALYWVDEERGEIAGECVYGTEPVGFTDESIRRRRVPMDCDDVLAHVARSRSALSVPDASADPRCNPDFVFEAKTKSLCLAPIMGRDRVLGIIGADNPRSEGPVSPQQARSLALFCRAAGLALENAQLLDAVVRSEARYRTAIENSPDAVVGLDQNFLVTLWNRRAEALFGYQTAEACGRTLAAILDEAAYADFKRGIETEGVIRHADVAGRTRDGRRLDLTLSAAGREGLSGSAREWFVVMQDVTERKRLQSQLIQAEKLSAVGSLVAGVAHELNNPLTGVIGFAEFLHSMPGLPPEAMDDLRTLYSSAMRCRDIVQGLLVFARPGGSALWRVSLNDIVQATLALFEYRMVKTERIDLEADLAPALPEVAGDFQKIQQVLFNLISNACDALQGRMGRRVIRVMTRPTPEGGALIEVEDTGPGVPPSKRERIFEPFFTTKPPGKGTGLGLSISAEIVAVLKGSLRCGESPEGGARFTAVFPPCPPGVKAAESSPLQHLPPPATGTRALVIDDEPDIVKLMLRLLREDGIEAAAAAGFEDAARRIRAGQADLVVADVEMGPFKGTELVEAAKGVKTPPAFVFVTGDILNQTLTRELARLTLPILAKPFLRTDFLRVVRRALCRGKGSRV